MTTVLLLVDVQKNMLEPPAPVPDADAAGQAIKDLLGGHARPGRPSSTSATTAVTAIRTLQVHPAGNW